MNQRNRFASSDTSFQSYTNQNIPNNPRNMNRSFRHTPPRFYQSRVHTPHPYLRNLNSSNRRRPIRTQHYGYRNLRQPQRHGFSNTSELLNAEYQEHGIPQIRNSHDHPQQRGCACCWDIPRQHGFYGTNRPITGRHHLPIRHRISHPMQAWETDDGMANHVHRENQTPNRHLNLTLFHIHLLLNPALPPEERTATIDDGSDGPAEPYYDGYDNEEDIPSTSDEEEAGEERQDNDGLNEQTTLDCLTTKIYYKSEHQESDICVVCQMEYEENDILGCLECGHEYHLDCITRWLLHENFCPVCKRNALATEDAVDE